MEMNFLVIALAALVPLIMGFIWYHPKTFGAAWMASAGITEEQLKDFNMLKVFSLTYLLSLMAALTLQSMVIHQYSLYSLLMNEPGFGEQGSEITLYLESFMEKYGTNFRTFKHGALHGTLAGLFFALPILGINAMFERKGFKYVAINAGFWAVCFAVMGGIICEFA
jgi:hypothetical protein